MKLSVIGYSGSGKSTLAARFGGMMGVPVLHLDKVQFLPGWQERDLEEAREMVKEFLDQNQSGGWAIDGNYSKFHYERRMEESDLILFMNFPRRVCLVQALCRNWKYRGKSRESIADGCDEKMDLEFLQWILWKGRNKARREGYARLMEQYPDKVIELRSHRQAKRCMDILAERLRRRQVKAQVLPPQKPSQRQEPENMMLAKDGERL